MQKVTVDDLRLIASPIPVGAKLVRVFPDDGPHYDRMIVVSPEQDGRVLHLAGWIGDPLTPHQWAGASEALFPEAEEIRFERLRNGVLVPRHLRLSKPN